MSGVALIYLVLLVLPALIFAFREGIASWLKWYRSGFCKHEWQLYSTCSFGQKHWYKCTKCDERRLK